MTDQRLSQLSLGLCMFLPLPEVGHMNHEKSKNRVFITKGTQMGR